MIPHEFCQMSFSTSLNAWKIIGILIKMHMKLVPNFTLHHLMTHTITAITKRFQLISSTFSFPETVLLLVSSKNHDFWEGPRLRLTYFASLCAYSESSLTFWLAENTKRILCACSENWNFPEVAIFGANQKDRGFWGQQWYLEDPWLPKQRTANLS